MSRGIVTVFAVLLAVLAVGVTPAPGRFGALARQASPAASTPCPATTEEENAALIRRFFDEVWDQGDLQSLESLLSDDFVHRIPSAAGMALDAQAPGGRAAIANAVQQFREDFPDLRVRLEYLVADKDTVAALATFSGTQAGDLEVWGAPDTGRRMERVGAAFFRVACGKIAQLWVLPDNLTLLRQLGIISDDELATADTPTVATPVP